MPPSRYCRPDMMTGVITRTHARTHAHTNRHRKRHTHAHGQAHTRTHAHQPTLTRPHATRKLHTRTYARTIHNIHFFYTFVISEHTRENNPDVHYLAEITGNTTKHLKYNRQSKQTDTSLPPPPPPPQS